MLALWSLTGCVVRKVDFWGAKIEFNEGFDLRAGMNGIDKVDDRRGINKY